MDNTQSVLFNIFALQILTCDFSLMNILTENSGNVKTISFFMEIKTHVISLFVKTAPLNHRYNYQYNSVDIFNRIFL